MWRGVGHDMVPSLVVARLPRGTSRRNGVHTELSYTVKHDTYLYITLIIPPHAGQVLPKTLPKSTHSRRRPHNSLGQSGWCAHSSRRQIFNPRNVMLFSRTHLEASAFTKRLAQLASLAPPSLQTLGLPLEPACAAPVSLLP
jgi:hypothetical protein